MKRKPSEVEIVTARRGSGGKWTGHPDAVRETEEAFARSRERAARWPQDAHGHIDTRAAMSVLGRLFPTLRGADGIEPWDADRFLAWLCGPVPSSGAQHAGRFLLSVWNPSTDWREVARDGGIEGADERLRRFDIHDAAGTWDEPHRLACMTWLDAPFWP